MPASRFETPRKYPCASTLRSNSFSFTHFRKNASATPLVSRSFKTKDLRPFRFIHFQKNGRGRVPLVAQASACVGTRYCPSSSPGDSACFELSTVDCQLSALSLLTSTLTKNASASPLDSALTSKRASKSFTSNTYEKHTQGEGGLVAQASACVSAGLSVAATTAHQSRMTPLGIVATPRPLCHNRLLCQRKPLRAS